MKFQIGDRVQVGTRVGTIMDVGTVLIEADACLVQQSLNDTGGERRYFTNFMFT